MTDTEIAAAHKELGAIREKLSVLSDKRLKFGEQLRLVTDLYDRLRGQVEPHPALFYAEEEFPYPCVKEVAEVFAEIEEKERRQRELREMLP